LTSIPQLKCSAQVLEQLAGMGFQYGIYSFPFPFAGAGSTRNQQNESRGMIPANGGREVEALVTVKRMAEDGQIERARQDRLHGEGEALDILDA
jgi:hypothetical protein